MTPTNFDRSFNKLIDNEGGYTANPTDRGNWTSGKIGVGVLKGTKYGISAMSYPNLDIKNLSLEQAKAIYKRDFWDKCMCDKLPDTLSFFVFDLSVNAGTSRAIKILQKALGLNFDGVMGNQTIAKINAINDDNKLDILLNFMGETAKFYASTSEFKTFGKGWINRIGNNFINAI